MRRKLIVAAVLTVVLLVAFATTAATAPARAATAVDDDYVLKVLVRGAPLHQANGIWADGGRLYVGDRRRCSGRRARRAERTR